jgi:hypothetical protein
VSHWRSWALAGSSILLCAYVSTLILIAPKALTESKLSKMRFSKTCSPLETNTNYVIVHDESLHVFVKGCQAICMILRQRGVQPVKETQDPSDDDRVDFLGYEFLLLVPLTHYRSPRLWGLEVI